METILRKEVAHGYYTHDEQGRFHSYNDEPAIVIDDYVDKDEAGEDIEYSGYRAWYKNGLLHRENAPAVIHNDGREYNYLNGDIWE